MEIGLAALFLLPITAVVIAQWIMVRTISTGLVDQGVTIKGALDNLEHQINSNMERQIKQAVSEAIAIERLRVQEALIKQEG